MTSVKLVQLTFYKEKKILIWVFVFLAMSEFFIVNMFPDLKYLGYEIITDKILDKIMKIKPKLE